MNASLNATNAFETLENRELLSAGHHHAAYGAAAAATSSPLAITQTGGILQIAGTAGSDQITVAQNGNTYSIANGSWTTQITGNFSKLVINGNGGNDSIQLGKSVTTDADLYGGTGNDTLLGSNANDNFYSGGGTDVMKGGSGRNVFVTLGSKGDTITGGGNVADGFWMDYSKSEVVTDFTLAQRRAGAMHSIASFLNGASTTLSGQRLADPATTQSGISYKNFAAKPLFSAAGPAADDVRQGYIGDCYWVVTLSSVAKMDPNRIRQSVVSLGDGTYAVQLYRNGVASFVRVDGDLPTWSNGALAYAGTGAGDSLWVAIMEKAFTYVRDGANPAAPAYSTIDNGGWMDESYSALGVWSDDLPSATSASSLVQQLAVQLKAGKSVTIGTDSAPAGSALISGHAYMVVSIGHDAAGNATVTLRNPWGVDGAGNDGSDDGYVTVTPQQLFKAFLGASFASV